MPRSLVYLHERPDWPEFTWDASAIAHELAAIRHRQGRLLGRMEALGFDLRSEAGLAVLTSDVVKSSAIEGEKLDPNEVRSSLARRLGLDFAGLPRPSRDVEGVVEMLLDATRSSAAPLTQERLFGWHAALFPTGRTGLSRITVGAWRTAESGPMQVVSGPIGHERVHFEAPRAQRLEAEMRRFLRDFESPSATDPVLRAGIAHLWFITIHPFEDGNGASTASPRSSRPSARTTTPNSRVRSAATSTSRAGWRGSSAASAARSTGPTGRWRPCSARGGSGSASRSGRSTSASGW